MIVYIYIYIIALLNKTSLIDLYREFNEFPNSNLLYQAKLELHFINTTATNIKSSENDAIKINGEFIHYSIINNNSYISSIYQFQVYIFIYLFYYIF